MTIQDQDVRIAIGALQIDAELLRFVEAEVLPGTGIDPVEFWRGASEIFGELTPVNRALLARRAELQASIDERLEHGEDADEQWLRAIGYLVREPEPFVIATRDVDEEIASVPGPQLVVPVSNARFAANAVNARWGSLYDALYGTDVVPDEGELARGEGYNEARGAEVVRRARAILDTHFPLEEGSHADATAYSVDGRGLAVTLAGEVRRLAHPEALVGHQGAASTPTALVLRHHQLHVLVQIDREHRVGAADAAGIKDVLLESAVTTIMDLEDSVAAVDAADKVAAYRNWLGLMKGTLSATVTKGGRTFTRSMSPDVAYVDRTGAEAALDGRSLMLVRHVGHLMTTPAVWDSSGAELPEGILDALVATACALHDLRGPAAGGNSRTGSIYVVKPKQHGPEEVAFTDLLFTRVEKLLGLPRNTLKVGIMDEERRTTLNLKACIHAVRDRVVFINTGFLDRTGDEIHTSTRRGAVVRKAEMKEQLWLQAYEDANVDAGLACGFAGRAQIGKGMWAAPDEMAAMLATKGSQPTAGASCAWVPSPTAATLHALHYLEVDVAARQAEISRRAPRSLAELLTVPVDDGVLTLTSHERQLELDNNVQSTLGYVVRWVDQGVGCSKVPDLSGTALMEDRATCRISSQHVANWLLHGVVSREEVEDSLRRMALVVDGQNAGLPGYEPMAPAYDGDAFLAARALVLEGLDQPSGYTEPILHAARRRRKAALTGASA